MSQSADSAREDLAFLRGLVEGDSRPPESFAKAMLSAGLIFGAQCVFHLGEFAGLYHLPPNVAVNLIVPFAPGLAWLAYVVWIRRRAPKAKPTSTRRAIDIVFQSIGLVSLVVLPVTLFIAFRQRSLALVFMHTVVILSALGAAWHVAFRLTRRAWMLAVSVGWLASAAAIGVAAAYENFTALFAIGAFALLALMALPGAILLRQSGQGARS